MQSPSRRQPCRREGAFQNRSIPPGASKAEINQRPTWLAQAHTRLDRAVFAAYGWPDDLSGEAILEQLLALNLARG